MAAERFPGVDLTVRCTDRLRGAFPAKYKIAAWWQGGAARDLKTFGFADDSCVERVYRAAIVRAARIPLAHDERIGPMEIFDLAPGAAAAALRRRTDLERRFVGPAPFDPLLDG